MSLAVWLGEDRKCSAAVVGLDLLLGLRRCSFDRSFIVIFHYWAGPSHALRSNTASHDTMRNVVDGFL